MNEVLKTIMNRRSRRRFQSKPLAENELDAILQAGLCAPSAGGRQSGRMVVCRDRALIRRLGQINRAAFHRPAGQGMAVSKDQPSIADDPGIADAFYGAPVLVALFCAVENPYASYDAAVMAQNMLLAAASLGIGGCIIGRAPETFAPDEGRELLRSWGVAENETPHLFVILGYPDGAEPSDKPRKPGRIVRVG